MKKITFITTQALNERNLKRFNLLFFIKDGWKVNYWNVQNVFYKNKFKNTKKKYKILRVNNIKFNNISSLIRAAFSTEYSYYVDFLDNSFLSFILRKILSYKNNNRILIDSANHPQHNIKNLDFKLLLNQMKFFFFYKSCKIFFCDNYKKDYVKSF